MPIYEYECGKGHNFELMVSMSSPDPKTCIVTGCRSKPKRLVSASGFILKGSGWYASDYPSDARKEGWDQEKNAVRADDVGHTCTAGCDHGSKGTGNPATDESAMPTTPAAKPEPAKKPKVKNPYSSSSGKKKSTKTAKTKS